MVLAADAVDLECLVAEPYRAAHPAQVLVVPVGLAGQEDPVDVCLVRAHHRVEPVGVDAQVDHGRLVRGAR